jgi:ATP-dependent DNA helicase RecQ
MASLSRPELVGSLGARVAQIGRLPLLGSVAYATKEAGERSSAHRANSAVRVRALHEALTLPEPLANAVSSLDGPVLLVDDMAESGWTVAVAARLLRRAGAPGVLPLLLAVQG